MTDDEIRDGVEEMRRLRDEVDASGEWALVHANTMRGLEDMRRLRAIVASALSEKADRVCWRDIYNPEVAALVGVTDFDPDGVRAPVYDPQLLPRPQFLGNCAAYYDCLALQAGYTTPTLDPNTIAKAVVEWFDLLQFDDAARLAIMGSIKAAYCDRCGAPRDRCKCRRTERGE